MRKVLRSRLSEKNGSIVGRIESTHGIHVFMSNPYANNDENKIITVKGSETGNVFSRQSMPWRKLETVFDVDGSLSWKD